MTILEMLNKSELDDSLHAAFAQHQLIENNEIENPMTMREPIDIRQESDLSVNFGEV